jgi:hypothetical protein
MKSPTNIALAFALCLLALPKVGHVAPTKNHTLNGTVFGDSGAQVVPLAEVQVRCYGTDDSVHDDVVSPVTNEKGAFVAHIPNKYGTFVLVFVDIKSTYWPKQMRLSPTADPTGLGRIVLFPRKNMLSSADRKDVEHIQQLLTGTDPNFAKVLLADLQEKPTSGVYVAHSGAIDPDKLPQIACSDLEFSSAFLANYPKTPAACQDARVYKGRRYAKFVAKVRTTSPEFITVELLNASGAAVSTLSFKPTTNSSMLVNGDPRKFSDLAVGEKLTFWVSEKRLDAMELPGSTEHSWAVVPPK